MAELSASTTAETDERPEPLDDSAINRRLRAQYAEIARLAGGLAHEIKNPLSTMSLNLDLLVEDFQGAETPRDRRVLQKLERVRKETGRLNDIVEDFLRFAKVQDLKVEPERPQRRRRRPPRLLRAPGDGPGDRDPDPVRPGPCRWSRSTSTCSSRPSGTSSATPTTPCPTAAS